MKKTLNDIFDEANANEIESLVNKNDAPKVPDDTLDSIKKRVYAKTGIPNARKKKPFIFRWQAYVTAAACLCLILGGIFILPRVMRFFIGFEVPDETSETQMVLNENKNSDSDTEHSNNNNSNNNSSNNNSGSNSTPLENINNGILKEASTEAMDVPQNMKLLGTKDATEYNNSKNIRATVVTYSLDGNVVNWTTENDFIYVITSGNNRLVIINSKTMSAVYNTPLAGVPAEMNIVGDKIYISLPDLCRIDIFSKFTCKKESSLYFDHEVSSFCLDGDYIYYSEHDQHCRVFKKNLVTDELTSLEKTFYFPKLYLNKDDRILYIGESQTTGSDIYYYDADTLQLKSMFSKNDYGIMNHTREIFHIGDQIFWGNYCLSDTNAKQLIARYGTADYGSVVFASDELVSTYEGLFLTDTCECIIDYYKADFDFEYVLVSESYNVFFRQRTFDRNMIIGVNFELQ